MDVVFVFILDVLEFCMGLVVRLMEIFGSFIFYWLWVWIGGVEWVLFVDVRFWSSVVFVCNDLMDVLLWVILLFSCGEDYGSVDMYVLYEEVKFFLMVIFIWIDCIIYFSRMFFYVLWWV